MKHETVIGEARLGVEYGHNQNSEAEMVSYGPGWPISHQMRGSKVTCPLMAHHGIPHKTATIHIDGAQYKFTFSECPHCADSVAENDRAPDSSPDEVIERCLEYVFDLWDKGEVEKFSPRYVQECEEDCECGGDSMLAENERFHIRGEE